MLRQFINYADNLYNYVYKTPDPVLRLVSLKDRRDFLQASRDLMNENAIEYLDDEITNDDFCTIEGDFPFKTLPVLHVDRETISHPNTILRYVGRICKLYPSKDMMNSAVVDQWIEYHTEFMYPISMNMYPDKMGLELSQTQLSNHKQWLMTTHIPQYFILLEEKLQLSEWICTDTKSAADYCWLATLKWLFCGQFSGIDYTYFAEYPNVKSYLLSNIKSNLLRNLNVSVAASSSSSLSSVPENS